MNAEDWGAYALVPVSAPAFVLESAGTGDGAGVSIGKPAGAAHQKWTITPQGERLFSIQPAANPALALAVAKGANENGAAIVLEKESGQPWQLWSLTKHASGSYSLTPSHVTGLGLDLLGGKQMPGAPVDLWTSSGNDPHLQWLIKPLAGSIVAEAKASAAPGYVPPCRD